MWGVGHRILVAIERFFYFILKKQVCLKRNSCLEISSIASLQICKDVTMCNNFQKKSCWFIKAGPFQNTLYKAKKLKNFKKNKIVMSDSDTTGLLDDRSMARLVQTSSGISDSLKYIILYHPQGTVML